MEPRIGRSCVAARVFGASIGWAAAICFGASVAIADADPRVDEGEALYHQYCGACHGISADGKGAISSMLTPKPADLR